MQGNCKVLIADDHTLVRAGLKILLLTIPNIEVVGEVSDGSDAIKMATELKPDIVLMDIAMKTVNGLDATARIKEHNADIRVLILSMHANEEYVLQALRAGASGYLVKEAATTELELAIAAVSRGETYLSPPVSRTVVDGYVNRTAGAAQAEGALTPRQRQILEFIAKGLGTKEIAYELDLSVKTVETHRAMLMERLGIRDVAGLTRYAIRHGIVSPEE